MKKMKKKSKKLLLGGAADLIILELRLGRVFLIP